MTDIFNTLDNRHHVVCSVLHLPAIDLGANGKPNQRWQGGLKHRKGKGHGLRGSGSVGGRGVSRSCFLPVKRERERDFQLVTFLIH